MIVIYPPWIAEAGKYVWRPYKQVHYDVIAIGAAIHKVGVQPVSFCSLMCILLKKYLV